MKLKIKAITISTIQENTKILKVLASSSFGYTRTLLLTLESRYI